MDIPVDNLVKDAAPRRHCHLCQRLAFEIEQAELRTGISDGMHKKFSCDDSSAAFNHRIAFRDNFFPVSTFRRGARRLEHAKPRRTFIAGDIVMAVKYFPMVM